MIMILIYIAVHRRHVCPLQRLGYREYFFLFFVQSIIHSTDTLFLGLVRRPDPSESEFLRLQRLRPAVWRLFAMLGRDLVSRVGCVHGRGHRCGNRRVSRVI